MKSLLGTGVALVTPFKTDLSVDIEALKNIVDYSIKNDVDYLVVLGTTAENATLTTAEKKQVIQTVIEANQKRLPLVLGVGGNNTQQLVDEFKTLDLSQFIAILSVSPYYNKPTQEGIYQHFKAISEASPLPIILYNVPGRTGSNILPATVLRLATDFKNIVGIKEASGNIEQAMEIIRKKNDDFHFISGDDMTALATVLAGGSGVISVIGQGLPKAFSKMIRLGLERKVNEAYEIQYALFEVLNMIFEQGNPAGIKEIFKHLGLANNTVRLPLVSVDESLSERIASFLKNFKI